MSITVTLTEPGSGAQLEKIVDAEIANFDLEFQRLSGNSAMTPSERSILKTYLGIRLGAVKREA